MARHCRAKNLTTADVLTCALDEADPLQSLVPSTSPSVGCSLMPNDSALPPPDVLSVSKRRMGRLPYSEVRKRRGQPVPATTRVVKSSGADGF